MKRMHPLLWNTWAGEKWLAQKEGLRIYWRKINNNSISKSEVRTQSAIMPSGSRSHKAADANEGTQYNCFSKICDSKLQKKHLISFIFLFFLVLHLYKTNQIPYSKIILMKCLESDHNTVKVTNYDWQKKEKGISGKESLSWYFREVYICIRHMASLKSGQTGGSFTASGIRVKCYNLKWPILKENKTKTNVNTMVQADWLY